MTSVLIVEDEESLADPLAFLLRKEGFEASAHVLRGDPASLIVEAAVRAQIDLIVLGTHGKTGMDAFWAGSVAHRIVSQSRIPLLLIPVGKG